MVSGAGHAVERSRDRYLTRTLSLRSRASISKPRFMAMPNVVG
jgi:hypothetical protein